MQLVIQYVNIKADRIDKGGKVMKAQKECDLIICSDQLLMDDYLTEVKSFGFFRSIFFTGISMTLFGLTPFMIILYIGLIIL